VGSFIDHARTRLQQSTNPRSVLWVFEAQIKVAAGHVLYMVTVGRLDALLNLFIFHA
jgi:hypothetical protein